MNHPATVVPAAPGLDRPCSLREQKKQPEMKMGLRNLANGEEQVFDSIQTWAFLKGGKFLLAQKYRGEGKAKGGSDLILLSLEDGSRLTIGNVSSFAPNESESLVALRIESDSGEGGVQILNPATNALTTPCVSVHRPPCSGCPIATTGSPTSTWAAISTPSSTSLPPHA